MSSKTIYDKYYAGTPGWARGVVNVIVVGGVAYLAYRLYKDAQRRKDLQEAGKQSLLAKQELAKLAEKGIYQSYNSSVYTGFVDKLVQAMGGCGTDEGQVFAVFKQLINDADVLALVAAWGVQYYQPCSWTSPIAYMQWLVDDKAYGGSISDWLGYDLSADDIAKINNDLLNRGINYRF